MEKNVAILKFDPTGVRRVVNHMMNSKEWGMSYFEEGAARVGLHRCDRPQLIFVHDQGIYLMSNGRPRDLISGDQESGKSFVVYADGHDPHRNPNFWDDARHAVGGDDFAEYIDLSPAQLEMISRPSFTGIKIKVTAKSLVISVLTKTANGHG
jgi:hypothetical protein